jgi:thymidine kinase
MEPLVLGSHENAGWIEVVCGSMFSGKTEELIRRLRRAEIARQQVEIFKPALDTRYRREAVVSHDETTLASTPVDTAAQVILLSSGADVVGVDEAQFFDGALVEACQSLARSGTRVLVAGLDQDFRGQPFEPIPQLMAVAEHVTKLHAICMKCGAPANHSQRIISESERVLVGADEAYEPRCRRCFVPPPAPAEEPSPPPAAEAAPERQNSNGEESENEVTAAPESTPSEAAPAGLMKRSGETPF